ncbi:uncharacterized protein LY79DRAFT_310420 [Colletotrichum navitas]|uniref:Uncharacterized protein n=1 Tax=Colletotrichum navitas TaxID=681940 RepID=A0AAD8PUK8_9PEZI|nr:uncharacterized protein LY79DRAFT_310420 [Colletotrichum navitas]KAK1580318.1 hypothetical protein LY79DRAFT_310420 [Colletotrichum navitas]
MSDCCRRDSVHAPPTACLGTATFLWCPTPVSGPRFLPLDQPALTTLPRRACLYDTPRSVHLGQRDCYDGMANLPFVSVSLSVGLATSATLHGTSTACRLEGWRPVEWETPAAARARSGQAAHGPGHKPRIHAGWTVDGCPTDFPPCIHGPSLGRCPAFSRSDGGD